MKPRQGRSDKTGWEHLTKKDVIATLERHDLEDVH